MALFATDHLHAGCKPCMHSRSLTRVSIARAALHQFQKQDHLWEAEAMQKTVQELNQSGKIIC